MAWNVPSKFYREIAAEWQRLVGAPLFDSSLPPLHYIPEKECPRLCKNLQTNWKTLQNLLLQHSVAKMRPIEHVPTTKAGSMTAAVEMDLPYDLKRAQKILDSLITVKEKDEKQAAKSQQKSKVRGLTAEQAAQMHQQLKELESYKLKYTNKTMEELEADLLELKPGCLDEGDSKLSSADSKESKVHMSIPECLALLREAYFRYTANTGEEPGHEQAKWLRLEQSIDVLAAMEDSTLFKIETSEGKTIVFQLIAMLKALQKKKYDVLAHSAYYAHLHADMLKPFVNFTGLKVATSKDSAEAIIDADIFYVDIATAILNKKSAQFCDDEKACLPGQRKAQGALGDEIDAIMDIHVKTTMQISTGGAKPASSEFIDFLVLLNEAIDQAEINLAITNEQQLRDAVRAHFASAADPYWQQNCQEDDVLDLWISAAIAGADLKKDRDCVVLQGNGKDAEFDKVFIVHTETTARVDWLSQWGNGVHPCVTVREMMRRKRSDKQEQKESESQQRPIKIPALSVVIAEGDVASHLQEYPELCVASGTIGSPGSPVEAMLQNLCPQVKRVLRMPRAERPLRGGPEGPQYPLRCTEPLSADGKDTKKVAVEPVYKCSYPVFRMLCANREEHYKKLLEAVINIQNQGYSALVFLKTIEQCNAFSKFLLANKVDRKNLQILCDISDGDENGMHPPEEVIVRRAGQPAKVTIATAAGGRALDAEGVDFAIQAYPHSERNREQEGDRVGRNGKLGGVCEIYCEEDYDSELAPPEVSQQDDIKIESDHRLSFWAARKQQQDLDLITARQPLREFKQKIQKEYCEEKRKVQSPEERQKLCNAWEIFFGKIDRLWQKPAALRAFACECFKDTVWKINEEASIATLPSANLATAPSPQPGQ